MLLTAGCLLYHGRAVAELLANELGPGDPEHLLSAKHEHLREIGGLTMYLAALMVYRRVISKFQTLLRLNNY